MVGDQLALHRVGTEVGHMPCKWAEWHRGSDPRCHSRPRSTCAASRTHKLLTKKSVLQAPLYVAMDLSNANQNLLHHALHSLEARRRVFTEMG